MNKQKEIINLEKNYEIKKKYGFKSKKRRRNKFNKKKKI